MKSDTMSLPRHFPYLHPTFGTTKRTQSSNFWKRSVYYWWWEYLKRNDAYLKTCESNGKGKLAKLYADFGDVRSDDFKSWWTDNQRGANLFANRPIESSIQILKDDGRTVRGHLNLAIPLNYPQNLVEKRLKKIISEQFKGKRGHQYAKLSNAKYQVVGQPNVPALQLSLMIFDYWKQHPDEPLWMIGNKFIATASNRIKDSDSPRTTVNLRKSLASNVSRHIKRTQQIIENTARGQFPYSTD